MIKYFWLFNISKRIISIPELGFHIHPGRKHNLLDSKHFYYTLDELINCYKYGTIAKHKKELLVKLTNEKNSVNKKLTDHRIIKISEVPMVTRFKMSLDLKEEKFEELEFIRESDEKFAEEFAGLHDELSSTDK